MFQNACKCQFLLHLVLSGEVVRCNIEATFLHSQGPSTKEKEKGRER